MVSNYKMMLKTEYKGYLGAAPLRLELIVVFQRWEEEKVVGERVMEGVAVKVGRPLIHSQLSCTGGRGVGRHEMSECCC
jgi:hypothetical protein